MSSITLMLVPENDTCWDPLWNFGAACTNTFKNFKALFDCLGSKYVIFMPLNMGRF